MVIVLYCDFVKIVDLPSTFRPLKVAKTPGPAANLIRSPVRTIQQLQELTSF